MPIPVVQTRWSTPRARESPFHARKYARTARAARYILLRRAGSKSARQMGQVDRRLLAMCLAGLLVTACGRTGTDERFVPGLGELMSLQQMRHVKLWLAAEAGNWELADYEIDELSEGFDDIVRFHPTHKDSPVAPKDAIPR